MLKGDCFLVAGNRSREPISCSVRFWRLLLDGIRYSMATGLLRKIRPIPTSIKSGLQFSCPQLHYSLQRCPEQSLYTHPARSVIHAPQLEIGYNEFTAILLL